MKFGARWDSNEMLARCRKAVSEGLIEYIEVNYPVASDDRAPDVGVPIYVHQSANPLCSAFGPSWEAMATIREQANLHDSPWVGEHLSWQSASSVGHLQYTLNPIYDSRTLKISIENVQKVKQYYGRPVALELGVHYSPPSAFASELHFLREVAAATDSPIILDLAHLVASNRNCGRASDFGMDVLAAARVIEIHVAGIKAGNGGNVHHDGHGLLPDRDILDLLARASSAFESLKAVTFEHDADAQEGDFYRGLEQIRQTVGEVR